MKCWEDFRVIYSPVNKKKRANTELSLLVRYTVEAANHHNAQHLEPFCWKMLLLTLLEAPASVQMEKKKDIAPQQQTENHRAARRC